MSARVGKRPTFTYRNFSRADDVSILDYLEMSLYSFNWQIDVDVFWSRFKEIINYCLKNVVPLQVKTVRRHNPCITREIIHLKRKLKRKIRKKQRNRSEGRDLSHTLKHKLKTAKARYFSETLTQFMSDSPHGFWRHISPQQENVQYVSFNDRLVTDEKKLAQKLNEYFHSVFDRPAESSVKAGSELSGCLQSNISTVVLSEQGILSLLLDIDTKLSPGPDGIPNEFLKRYAEWISKYLLIIFDASLKQRKLPPDWLIARIVPVHKGGSRFNIENYRPISITCTICKIFEHILSKQLFTYIES